MSALVDPQTIGIVAALLTTACWLPQTLKLIRERDTRSISLISNLVFAVGLVLWLTYGVMIQAWPVIFANIITLALILVIIGLKLRYG
jgi:MtN3 and saliva related transmembrane protein